MEKISLAGKSLCELEKLLSLERFRAGQIHKWIIRGVCDFDQMTDIPLSMRSSLKADFRLFSGSVVSCHDDSGAKKIVIELKDGLKIESVLLKDAKNRLTACLSTQAGCPIGCVFCKTGSLGFSRNLEANEIAEQFLFLRGSAAAAKPENKDEHIIDNIVIMGMGEPLLNMAHLRKALAFFNDPGGMNFSGRRITASTCGICEGLFDIANNGPFIRIALSLATADEQLRQKMIPAAKSNPLEKIKEALVLFQRNGGGRVTLEIPLLGGINTRSRDAASIAEFAAGIDSVVNVIPWNPVAGLELDGKPLREPEKKEIRDFLGELENYGLKTTMRLHKGRGIMGACGQLGALSVQADKHNISGE
jgi:23S rRNA (adenine2503-C2)-methyltransferase